MYELIKCLLLKHNCRVCIMSSFVNVIVFAKKNVGMKTFIINFNCK